MRINNLISSLDTSSSLRSGKDVHFYQTSNYRYIFKSYCRLPLLQCLQLQVIPLIQEVLIPRGPEKEREQPLLCAGFRKGSRRETGRRKEKGKEGRRRKEEKEGGMRGRKKETEEEREEGGDNERRPTLTGTPG